MVSLSLKARPETLDDASKVFRAGGVEEIYLVWDLIEERAELNRLLTALRRVEYNDETMLEIEKHFEERIEELDMRIDGLLAPVVNDGAQ